MAHQSSQPQHGSRADPPRIRLTEELRPLVGVLAPRAPRTHVRPDDGTGEESKIVGLVFRSPNKLPVTFTPLS